MPLHPLRESCVPVARRAEHPGLQEVRAGAHPGRAVIGDSRLELRAQGGDEDTAHLAGLGAVQGLGEVRLGVHGGHEYETIALGALEIAEREARLEMRQPPRAPVPLLVGGSRVEAEVLPRRPHELEAGGGNARLPGCSRDRLG